MSDPANGSDQSTEDQAAGAKTYLFALAAVGIAVVAIFANGLGGGGTAAPPAPGNGTTQRQQIAPSGPNYPTLPSPTSNGLFGQAVPGGQAGKKAEQLLNTGLDAATRGAEVTGDAIERVGDALTKP